MANALGLDLAAVHQARDTRALNAQNQQINALNIQAAQQKAALAPKINSLSQQFSTGSLPDKKAAALQMGQYDPARSKQMFEMYSKMSEEQKAQTKELTANVAKYGVGMLQETDPNKWTQSYTQNLTAIAQRYGADAVKDAPGLNEPIEKQRAWVQEQVNDAMGFQEVYKAAQPEKVSPNTALAKAKADLDNGLITQAQYDQIAQNEMGVNTGFEGTGMDAQSYNKVIAYNLKKQNGQPTSAQEDMEYNLLLQRLSRAKTVTTPEGTYQVPGMDMSGFYQPGQPTQGNAPPQPTNGQPTQANPAPQPTTPPAFTPKAVKSVGQEQTDKEFAKTYTEYRAQGGSADLDKSINQLEEVATALESGQDTLTGPLMGKIPSGMKAAMFPDSLRVQDRVEEIVQKNLRVILGPQFTEKEGQRLIERAFNPSLSEAENAKRVRALLNTIKERKAATEKAAKYFEENGGTLKGFNPNEQNVIEYDSQGNPK